MADIAVTIGPADVGVDAPPPATVTATLTLIGPAGVVVPGNRPTFTVQGSADSPDEQAQIQYAGDAGFTTATTVSATLPTGVAGVQVSAPAAAAVADGTVYWRARVVGPYGTGDWSSTASFAVDSSEGQAVAAGSFTVTDTATAAAHLWFVDTTDDGAAVLVGTGFGASPVVQLGDTVLPVLGTVVLDDTGAGADRRIVPVDVVDPWHQVITAQLPEGVDPDSNGDAVTVVGGGRSNGQFLPLLPAAPLPAAGWTVEVIAMADLTAYAHGAAVLPLAKLSRFVSLSLQSAISDPGGGTVVIRTDDPVWSQPLADGRVAECLYTYENLWVVKEDGQWRGEFFGRKVDPLQKLSPAENAGHEVTITGPGAGDALNWAQVFGKYYPATQPKNTVGVYQFTNIPVMAGWLQLLGAAQRRGTIAYVHCQFSSVKDTGGQVWEDTPPAKPKNTSTSTLGSVLFTNDSSALNAAGTAAVAAIAKKMKAVSAIPAISIVGHTDSNGSVAYNQQKGLDRANTVANAVLAIAPTARVTTSSRGETQPIASNATAAGRARNRRVVVTYQSSPTYVDTVWTPERNTKLLDLLNSITSGQTTAENRGPIHCEWVMRKGFLLQVRSQIGKDCSKTVVYHEGSTYQLSQAITYDRSDLANLIAVQNDQGAYKVAADAPSIARWGQREMHTLLQGSYSTTVHAQIANTQRLAYREQTATITISVRPGPGRRPFADFTVGDYIGLHKLRPGRPSQIDKQRVMALTVTVDADGQAAYELTIANARQSRLSWLQTQIDSLINRKRGIRAYIQDSQPTGGLPGDLWTPSISANV